jgi:hypothetical protein
MGVVFALYGCWRTGAVREEQASGRAEHLAAFGRRDVTGG